MFIHLFICYLFIDLLIYLFFVLNRTLSFPEYIVFLTFVVNMNFHLCTLFWRKDLGNYFSPCTLITQNTTSLKAKSKINYRWTFAVTLFSYKYGHLNHLVEEELSKLNTGKHLAKIRITFKIKHRD